MTIRRTFLLLIAVSFAVLLVVVKRPIIEFFRDPLFEETETRRYETIQDATKLMHQGWLPHLPPSSRDIQEKRHLDYGLIVVKFLFDPSDYPSAFPPMVLIDSKNAPPVGPTWIVRQTEWIPEALQKGDIGKMFSEGFELYRFELYRLDQLIGKKSWHMLIHPVRGIAYGWSANQRVGFSK